MCVCEKTWLVVGVGAGRYTIPGLRHGRAWHWQDDPDRRLAGDLEEAQALTERMLALTRAHQEHGQEVYALRLLCAIAARRDPPRRGRGRPPLCLG